MCQFPTILGAKNKDKTETSWLPINAGAVLVAILSSLSISYANPTGGRVVAGAAGIHQRGLNLDVNQASQRAVINWQSFNIDRNEQVNFNQPNRQSSTLNRVIGDNPSALLGKMNANGNVYLVNQNGIMVGKDAQINVGSLVASTTNISNKNFMAEHMKFNQPGKPDAKIINQGNISAQQGGLVALVAPGVANQGVINARLGKISLASGDAFTLDFFGDNLVNFTVSKEQLQNIPDANGNPLSRYVNNSGEITADGGVVAISAQTGKAVLDSIINVDGHIQAQGVANQRATVTLAGGKSTQINIKGTIDATGNENSDTGGKVEIRAGQVKLSNGSLIDVSAQRDGGTVLVGGDYQGSGTGIKAQTLTAERKAVINADSTTTGNGGKVILWSDNHTSFDGKITAHGGQNAGNGGLVEVSGKKTLHYDGDVDASAAKGKPGQLLLDPGNLIVANSSQSNARLGKGDEFVNVQKVNYLLQTGTDVSLKANNDLTVRARIDGRSVDGASGAGINLFGGRNVNIFKNILTNNGDIKITAVKGDISMASGKQLYAGNGNITLNAGKSVQAQNVLTSGAVNLKAGDAISVAQNLAGGNLDIKAGSHVNLSNVCVAQGLNCKKNAKISEGSNKDIIIQSSNGDILHTGKFVTDHNTNIQADNGAVSLTRVDVRKTNAALNVAANKDIVLSGDMVTRDNGSQTYTSNNGNITFNGGVLASGNGLKVSALSTSPNQGNVTFNQPLGFASNQSSTTADDKNSLGALNVSAGGSISLNKDVDIKGNQNPCTPNSDCSLKLIQLGDGDVRLNGKVEVHSGDVLLGREDLNTTNFGNGKIMLGSSLRTDGDNIILNGNVELFDSGNNPSMQLLNFQVNPPIDTNSTNPFRFFRISGENLFSLDGLAPPIYFYALLDPNGNISTDYSKISTPGYQIVQVTAPEPNRRLLPGETPTQLPGLDPAITLIKGTLIEAPNGAVKITGKITGSDTVSALSITSKAGINDTSNVLNSNDLNTFVPIGVLGCGTGLECGNFTKLPVHEHIDISNANLLNPFVIFNDTQNNPGTNYQYRNQIGMLGESNTYKLNIALKFEIPIIKGVIKLIEDETGLPPTAQQTPLGINLSNGQFGIFNNLNLSSSTPAPSNSGIPDTSANNTTNLTLNSSKTAASKDSKANRKTCENGQDGTISLETSSIGQSVDLGRDSPELGGRKQGTKKTDSSANQC